MPISPSPEGYKPQVKEAPKKTQKHVKKVKGLYAFAAEHHKNMQAYERKSFFHKMLRGFIEPAAIHMRALRLQMAMNKYKSKYGDSPILANDFVKEALTGWGLAKSGKISEGTVRQVQSLSAAHKEVVKALGVHESSGQKVEDLTPEEQAKARQLVKNLTSQNASTPEAINNVVNTLGISQEQATELVNKIQQAQKEVQSAKIQFKTPEYLKDAVADEVLFAGLNPEQQVLAKKVARASKGMTATAVLRYGGVALVTIVPGGALFTGLAIGGGALLFGTTANLGRLRQQGVVHELGKKRSATVHGPLAIGLGDKIAQKTKVLPFIGKLTSVDWEKEGKGKQLWRAAIAGGLISAGLRFAPQLEHLATQAAHGVGEAAGNLSHSAGDAAHNLSQVNSEAVSSGDALQGPPHEILIPHVPDGELKVPDGWHFGDIAHHQNPNILYDNAGDKVASNFTSAHGTVHFQYDSAYASSHGIDTAHLNQTLDASHAETDKFTEFVNEHSTDLKINPPSHDLPAGGHEAYGMTDYSNGNSFTIQSYDHLGDQANALEMNVDGHHLVFLPTQHIHGHPAWQFTPGDNHHMVTMWKDGQEIEVTSGQAASMLHITHGELQNWIHSGHPAGASSDFDYSVGQNILGHNLLFGHLDKDHGVFNQLGVIRGHSGIHGELTNAKFGEQVYDFTNKLGTVRDEQFHSVIAPELQGIDSIEDKFLYWLFSKPVAGTLDRISDVGLRFTDADVLAFQQALHAQSLLGVGEAIAVASPYIAIPALAYLFGENRAAEGRNRGKTAGLVALETGLLATLPGVAALSAAAYFLGKVRGKKNGSKSEGNSSASASVNSETRPAGGPLPSDASTQTVEPVPIIPTASAQPPTQPLPATAAVDEEEENEVIPAPPAPAGLSLPEDEAQAETETLAEEPVESTVPANEEAVGGGVPPLAENPEATADVAEETTPQDTEEEGSVEGEATPESEESVSAAAPGIVPVDTTNLDVPAVAATVAGSELLKDQQPFEALQSAAPQAEKEAEFKEQLQLTGAQELLEKLLTPIANRLGIPESQVQTHVANLLQEMGKFERVGAFIVVADKLYKMSKNPELLKDVLGKVTAAVSAHAGQTREEVTAAVKEALASSGEAGTELAALGEEALPIIEEVAPILA